MKTLFAILFVAAAFLLPVSAHAQTNLSTANTVTLEWNPNIESDLAGYRVYLTQNTNAWTHAKNAGLLTTAQIPLPTPGRWFFMVTAFNTANLESLPSNIVEYTATNSPAKPSGFRFVSASVVRSSTVTTVTNLVYIP